MIDRSPRFADRDLEAIAEMGYHYLRSGGAHLASVIFEGLAAIKPSESYYLLGWGLAADHLGDRESAASCYARAGELDPSDGRPDVNLAEIELIKGNRDRAIALLRRAEIKSKKTGDRALEQKASALLVLVARYAPARKVAR